jgi:hypothetical protein
MMKMKKIKLAAFLLLLIFAACGGGKLEPEAKPGAASKGNGISNGQAASNVDPAADYDRKLTFVKRGNFKYIFAFQRKDGAKLESADKEFLKSTAPYETNQWVLTDDGASAFAGSNYFYTAGVLKKLGEKLKVTDHSPPKSEEEIEKDKAAAIAREKESAKDKPKSK